MSAMKISMACWQIANEAVTKEKIAICKEVFDDLYGRGQFTPPAGYEPHEVSGLLEKRIKYAQDTGRLKKS